MGLAHQYNTILISVALAAWEVSANLVRWAVRRGSNRRGVDGFSRGGYRATSAVRTRVTPLERLYAPSTVCRYRQIVARFSAWDERNRSDRDAAPDFVRFLAATGAAAGSARVLWVARRRDPQHLALLRTSICAVRAVIDRPLGLQLTADIRLPPRATPVSAASADTVSALRLAVRGVREKLLITLTCDLGLRPGQMAGLRWGDVRLRRRRVYLSGRQGRREIGIPAACLARLKDCARGRAPGDLLFPSPQCVGRPSTVRTLQNALRRLSERVGVASETTFTTLRKACLTNLPLTPPRADRLSMRPVRHRDLCGGPRQAGPVRFPSPSWWHLPSFPVRVPQPLGLALDTSTSLRTPSRQPTRRRPPCRNRLHQRDRRRGSSPG